MAARRSLSLSGSGPDRTHALLRAFRRADSDRRFALYAPLLECMRAYGSALGASGRTQFLSVVGTLDAGACPYLPGYLLLAKNLGASRELLKEKLKIAAECLADRELSELREQLGLAAPAAGLDLEGDFARVSDIQSLITFLSAVKHMGDEAPRWAVPLVIGILGKCDENDLATSGGLAALSAIGIYGCGPDDWGRAAHVVLRNQSERPTVVSPSKPGGERGELDSSILELNTQSLVFWLNQAEVRAGRSRDIEVPSDTEVPAGLLPLAELLYGLNQKNRASWPEAKLVGPLVRGLGPVAFQLCHQRLTRAQQRGERRALFEAYCLAALARNIEDARVVVDLLLPDISPSPLGREHEEEALLLLDSVLLRELLSERLAVSRAHRNEQLVSVRLLATFDQRDLPRA